MHPGPCAGSPAPVQNHRPARGGIVHLHQAQQHRGCGASAGPASNPSSPLPATRGPAGPVPACRARCPSADHHARSAGTRHCGICPRSRAKLSSAGSARASTASSSAVLAGAAASFSARARRKAWCCPRRVGALAQRRAAGVGDAAAQPHHLVQRLRRAMVTGIACGLQMQIAVMAQALRLQCLGLMEALRRVQARKPAAGPRTLPARRARPVRLPHWRSRRYRRPAATAPGRR